MLDLINKAKNDLATVLTSTDPQEADAALASLGKYLLEMEVKAGRIALEELEKQEIHIRAQTIKSSEELNKTVPNFLNTL